MRSASSIPTSKPADRMNRDGLHEAPFAPDESWRWMIPAYIARPHLPNGCRPIGFRAFGRMSIVCSRGSRDFDSRMTAFFDLFDDLRHERFEIVGAAARDDAFVGHHFLVDPLAAGVLDVLAYRFE